MENNPYQSPLAETVTQENHLHAPLASRWSRLGASILDGLILMVILVPLFILVYFLTSSGQGMEDFANQLVRDGSLLGDPILDTLVSTIITLGIYLAVNGVWLVKYGQTVGKRLVGIRVVDYRSGELISLGRIFGIRYVATTIISSIPFIGGIFGLVNVLFIFGNEKRCIHDFMANTKVVDA